MSASRGQPLGTPWRGIGRPQGVVAIVDDPLELFCVTVPVRLLPAAQAEMQRGDHASLEDALAAILTECLEVLTD